jgi:HEAT repeat protein
MMSRRSARWLTVFAFVTIVMIFSPTRAAVVALLRGESSFYDGLSTSSWSQIIREESIPYSPPGHIVSVDFDTKVPASTLDQVKKALGLQFTVTANRYPLREDDAAAIPVLIELLHDKDPSVRMYSAETLGAFGAKAEVAIPALKNFLTIRKSAGSASQLVERAAEAIASIESDIQKE